MDFGQTFRYPWKRKENKWAEISYLHIGDYDDDDNDNYVKRRAGVAFSNDFNDDSDGDMDDEDW